MLIKKNSCNKEQKKKLDEENTVHTLQKESAERENERSMTKAIFWISTNPWSKLKEEDDEEEEEEEDEEEDAEEEDKRVKEAQKMGREFPMWPINQQRTNFSGKQARKWERGRGRWRKGT